MRGIGRNLDPRLGGQFAEPRGQGGGPRADRPENAGGLPVVGRGPRPVVERMGVVGALEEGTERGDRADAGGFDADLGTHVARFGTLVLGEQPDRNAGACQYPVGQIDEAQRREFGGQDLHGDLHPNAGIVRSRESRRSPGRRRQRHQRVVAGPVGGHHPGVGDADVRRVEGEEENARPGVHLSVCRRNGGDEAAGLSHPQVQRLGSYRQLPLLTRSHGGPGQESRTQHRACRQVEREC